MEGKPESQENVEKRLKYAADTERFEDTTRNNNAPRTTTRCASSFFLFGNFQRHLRYQNSSKCHAGTSGSLPRPSKK